MHPLSLYFSNVFKKHKDVITNSLPAIFASSLLPANLYWQNKYEVEPNVIVLPLLFVAVSAILFSAIFTRVLNSSLAFLQTFWITFITFNFYLFRASYEKTLELIDSSHPIIQIMAVVMLIVVPVFIVQLLSKDSLRRPLLILALSVTGAMFAQSLIRIPMYMFRNRNVYSFNNYVSAPELGLKPLCESCESPDIYYLVFDRYASDSVLARDYDYQNELTSYLQSVGFVINGDSYSNYQFTPYSLASSLNGTYLDELSVFNDYDYTILPLVEMIQNPAIPSALQQQDYKFVNIGSWWGATERIKSADENINQAVYYSVLDVPLVPSDFHRLYFEKTLFYDIGTKGIEIGDFELFGYTKGNIYRKFFENQDKALKDVINNENAKKFVLTHFLVPHPPYVYDKKGAFPSYSPGENDVDIPEENKYVNQLKYVNSRIKEYVELIMVKSQGNAIVVLQADEGPFHPDYTKDSKWTDAPPAAQQHKLGIQSAIYVPDSYRDRLPAKWSAADVLTTVLNAVFDSGNRLKEDRHYIFNQSDPYLFRDISDTIHQTIR